MIYSWRMWRKGFGRGTIHRAQTTEKPAVRAEHPAQGRDKSRPYARGGGRDSVTGGTAFPVRAEGGYG
jgi:hypothetical protein